MHKNLFRKVALLGSALSLSACGSAGNGSVGSEGVHTSAAAAPGTSAPSSAASSPIAATTSPTPTGASGRSLVLNVTSNDGYQATLSLVVSAPVDDTGDTAPAQIGTCYFPQLQGEGKYVLVPISGTLTAKSVNGFSWPSDDALTVLVSDDSHPNSGGEPCNENQSNTDLAQTDGLNLTPGAPQTVWMEYETQVTPNNPQGWAMPLPWSSIEVAVDNQSGGTYTCTVVSKDAAYTPNVQPDYGCDFDVAAG